MLKKILIIEDETALLYALQSQLSIEGYRVFIADDGEKALKVLNTRKPDLIILDIILPKLNGWEFLKIVKANAETKNIPVVIISNLSDDASRQRGIKLGAKDYLPKINYSIAEIIDKVKKIV